MNQAGKIACKVHSASGFRDMGQDRHMYCVCEVPGYGRLVTEPRPRTGTAPDEPTLWEEELTFEVGPSEEPKQLRVALYAVSDEGQEGQAGAPVGDGMPQGEEETDDFIGGGSMSLAHLEEIQTQHNVRIPVVAPSGTHLADLSVDLRFFHSRTPARQRDANGREFIDPELAQAGPANAAKLLNERSPRSPTAAKGPGSPRIKPPPQDPPVPELPAHVRSTLKGDEERGTVFGSEH